MLHHVRKRAFRIRADDVRHLGFGKHGDILQCCVERALFFIRVKHTWEKHFSDL